MDAWFTHKCDKCNYELHTDGPWEFYRDKEGKRKIMAILRRLQKKQKKVALPA